MSHLYSPQKWSMEIGSHKWPLISHCNPDGRSPEGYNWSFWGHEWLPIPLVTTDYTNTIVFISNHLWRTKLFLMNAAFRFDEFFRGFFLLWCGNFMPLSFHEFFLVNLYHSWGTFWSFTGGWKWKQWYLYSPQSWPMELVTFEDYTNGTFLQFYECVNFLIKSLEACPVPH